MTEIPPDRVLNTCPTASLFYSITECIINHFVNIRWVLELKLNHYIQTPEYSVHDEVHTKKNRNLLFSISIYSCKTASRHLKHFFIYNNDENILLGYLIAKETFSTDILK